MADTDAPLYMLRLALRAAPLFQEARAAVGEVDLGYATHWALRKIFGEQAPQPFFLQKEEGRTLEVLGYGPCDADSLRRTADELALPQVHAICDWSSLASKAMPTDFAEGRRLGFSLRACPVVRKASTGEHHKKGAEVDAFLSEAWARPEDKLSREEVYRAWLTDRLGEAAKLESARLLSFRRLYLMRRTQGNDRKRKRLERPEARFEGVLEVRDPAAFAELLRRGVGRHRAFGFGMLLLRRA